MMFLSLFNLKTSSNPFKIKNSSRFQKKHEEDHNSPSSPFKKIFYVRWFRILICFILFLLFLLLWKEVGQRVVLLFFTVLPLFVGYGLSYLLEPVDRFFQRYFSKKVSQIIVFLCFLIFTLSLVLGLFFIFFIQLDDLYRKFLFKTGNANFENFLANIVKKSENNPIKDFSFVKKTSDTFQLSYTALDSEAVPTIIVVNKNEIAGVFILLLTISSEIPILKGICFTFMDWIYSNLTNYGYLKVLFSNLQSILLFLYLFFFTIVIAAFSLGKAKGFFNKIWNFLTKDYDSKKMLLLKTELKQNLSAWSKGLLLVQLYIFIGTGLFLFTAGIIFSSWSSYDESVVVLTLFMTFCNLVPYIGPTIGFIPIFTIGLIDVVNEGVNSFLSWVPLIIAVTGCLLVQIGESTLVTPLVYSKQVNINPIVIIIGLAVFGVLFGVLSMPLAIPVILVIKIVYRTFEQENNEAKKN